MSKPRDIADSAATINFIDTVTSNVQDQLDNLDPVPTNIAGGSAGTIPYQSAVNTTAMLAVGTAGQLLQTNGAGAPTWVDAGGGSQVDFVASGTIGNGVTVALKANGTVEVIRSISTSVGSAVVFESAAANNFSATFDSVAGKIVIVYVDNGNSNYGTAIVGTVSGASISFGAAVLFHSGNTNYTSATYDSAAGKIVIAYRNNSNSGYGTAIVGTVSGTSISFGSATVFNSVATSYTSAVFDSSTEKVIIAYQNTSGGSPSGNFGKTSVGTVSGTSISFGAAGTFKSSSTTYISAAYNSVENKVVIAYTDNVSTNYGTAIVGTVNGAGSNMSFGTPVTFESGVTAYTSAVYDSALNKIVIAYRDAGNSNYGTAIVGTVSGTSISFGTAVVFANTTLYGLSAIFSSVGGNVVIAYEDGVDNNYGKAIVGTVSGTSISFGTALTFESGYTQFISTAYDSAAGKVVIAYRDYQNSNFGTSVVFTAASNNSASFIGISDEAISDTATGSVTIKGGVSTNVTSLTPATDYYVQTDGSISATVSAVPAGKALSATSILLKGI